MIKVTVDNVANVLASIATLAKKETLVGIPSDEADRKDGNPINNAALGYIHENGSPARNIPPRPFLKVGVLDVKNKLASTLKKFALRAFNDKEAAEKGLNAAGLIAQAAVKERIRTSKDMEELKPETLAARARKGFKGTKPLLRTGQLLNSITFVVRDKNGKN